MPAKMTLVPLKYSIHKSLSYKAKPIIIRLFFICKVANLPIKQAIFLLIFYHHKITD